MDSKEYAVRYPTEIIERIEEIYTYTKNFSMSEQTSRKTVSEIILGIEQLEFFPEMGFNADERVEQQIKPPYVTRGLIVGDYIAFYQVLNEKNEQGKTVILISDLISTKSNWVYYFGRRHNS